MQQRHIWAEICTWRDKDKNWLEILRRLS